MCWVFKLFCYLGDLSFAARFRSDLIVDRATQLVSCDLTEELDFVVVSDFGAGPDNDCRQWRGCGRSVVTRNKNCCFVVLDVNVVPLSIYGSFAGF